MRSRRGRRRIRLLFVPPASGPSRAADWSRRVTRGVALNFITISSQPALEPLIQQNAGAGHEEANYHTPHRWLLPRAEKAACPLITHKNQDRAEDEQAGHQCHTLHPKGNVLLVAGSCLKR